MGEVKNKVFILDTNILLHEPHSIFSFKEHDVIIPMTVLEELDASVSGSSDIVYAGKPDVVSKDESGWGDIERR